MRKFLCIYLLIFNLITSVQATELEKKWEISGFAMPESIVANPNSNWIYVSNVNAKKSGYISRLTKDGKVDNYKWITKLNNPAGLALFKNRLYVADGAQVHIIDVKKESLIQSISSKEAIALNDVAISKEGKVFISDIATGKIFTIKNDKLEVFFKTDEIKHPNGLFVKNNKLFIANYATKLSLELSSKEYGSLYSVNLSNKAYEQIPSSFKLGGLDGLVLFNNNLLVSSGTTGELFAITNKQRILVNSFEKGLADISIQNRVLYAPFIFSKKISAYKIRRKNEK